MRRAAIRRLALRKVDVAQSLGAAVVVGLTALGAFFGTCIVVCRDNRCD